MTGLLAAQAGAGILVSGIAYRVPFSQAKATADYIHRDNLDTKVIVADPDYAVSTVAGYLDRPVLFANGRRAGTSVVWDSKCCIPQNPSTMELALAKATELHEDVLVLLNYVPASMDYRMREIASFQGAIVEDENYHLYLMRQENGSSGARR